MESLDFLNLATQAIYDKKGANIIALDLRAISSLTDFFIIAEGGVDRHVRAIADHIKDEAEKHGVSLFMEEGVQTGDWCALDFGGVIIHLFIPAMRSKYALERLWEEGKIVDIHLNVKI